MLLNSFGNLIWNLDVDLSNPTMCAGYHAHVWGHFTSYSGGGTSGPAAMLPIYFLVSKVNSWINTQKLAMKCEVTMRWMIHSQTQKIRQHKTETNHRWRKFPLFLLISRHLIIARLIKSKTFGLFCWSNNAYCKR